MINMDKAIELHKKAGMHFFDKAAMRFFNSRIESELFPNRCFVTSEQDDVAMPERRYTVRQFNADYRKVEDVSRFGAFNGKKTAIDLAENWER